MTSFQRAIAVFAGDQRLAAGLDGVAEIEKLAFERRQRDRHRIRAPRCDFLLDRGGFARNRSRTSQAVSLSPVMIAVPFVPWNLEPLGVARPESGGRLDHAGGAVEYRSTAFTTSSDSILCSAPSCQ